MGQPPEFHAVIRQIFADLFRFYRKETQINFLWVPFYFNYYGSFIEIVQRDKVNFIFALVVPIAPDGGYCGLFRQLFPEIIFQSQSAVGFVVLDD